MEGNLLIDKSEIKRFRETVTSYDCEILSETVQESGNIRVLMKYNALQSIYSVGDVMGYWEAVNNAKCLT